MAKHEGVRKVSATSFSVLECGARYVAENVFDLHSANEDAMFRGKLFHMAAEGVALLMKKGIDVGPEQVKEIVLALGAAPGVSAQIVKGVTWWAERMHGIVPIGVEDDGGFWKLDFDGVECVGKFDCVHIVESDGLVVVTDHKSGFVPDKETAWGTVQNLLYALAAMRIYDVPRVAVSQVSLGNLFSFLLEYDAADIDAVTPFLHRDAKRVAKAMERVAAATTDQQKHALLEDPMFAPRVHGWCPSCPIKRECEEYLKLIWLPDPELTGFGSRPASLEALRIREKLVGKEKEAIEKDLKADAAGAGDDGLVEAGYSVKMVSQVQQIKATPATERVVNKLVVKKINTVEEEA